MTEEIIKKKVKSISTPHKWDKVGLSLITKGGMSGNIIKTCTAVLTLYNLGCYKQENDIITM